MTEDVQQHIADGARPRLARVGDLLEHGRWVPANVLAVTDRNGEAWGRSSDVDFLRPHRPGRVTVSDLSRQEGPLTVVEVDDEPYPEPSFDAGIGAETPIKRAERRPVRGPVDPEQPAERTLIGPPHAHQDAPCTDACYEPERDVEDDVHYYVPELRPGTTFCGIGLEEDNDLSTTDVAGKATCDTCRAEADEDAAKPQPTVEPVADGPLLGLATTRQLLEELKARGEVTAPNATDGDLMVRRAREMLNNLSFETLAYRTAEPRAESGPLVPDDLDRFIAEQLKDPQFAAALEDANVRPRLILKLVGLRKARGLTVEQVAEDMQVKPKRVRAYEGGLTDPTLSMHQRYARAVGARIRVEVAE